MDGNAKGNGKEEEEGRKKRWMEGGLFIYPVRDGTLTHIEVLQGVGHPQETLQLLTREALQSVRTVKIRGQRRQLQTLPRYFYVTAGIYGMKTPTLLFHLQWWLLEGQNCSEISENWHL